MSVLRSITVTVTDSDTVAVSPTFGGYSGEHLATQLNVTVPVAWAGLSAYVTWVASDGWTDESSATVVDGGDPTFNYQLPYQSMKAGTLRISITAKETVDSLNTRVVHTANFSLNITKSSDSSTPYNEDFNDAIEALDARLQTLEGNASNINNTVDYITFNQGVTTPAYHAGRLYWNDTLGTLNIMSDSNDVTLQSGQETWCVCRNNTLSTILNGKVVYISGAIGQYPTIALARADADATAGIIGVATQDILSNALGKVTVYGVVNDIDTSTGGFTDGDNAYLSTATAGGMVTTTASLPNYALRVGKILYSHAIHGKLLVMPGPAWETYATFNSLRAKNLNATLGRYGDVSGGNYTELETSTGFVRFVGSAIVWNDLQISLSRVRAPAATTPTWTSYKGAEVPAFSASAAANTVYFTIQMPHNYKEGTDVEFHLHLAYPDANAGNSRWQMTHSWANMDVAFPSPTTTTAVTIAAPGTSGTDKHKMAELVAAISGTGKTISSVLICSLTRLGSDVLDTYGSVIYGLSADFHYQSDTIGSRTATTK